MRSRDLTQEAPAIADRRSGASVLRMFSGFTPSHRGGTGSPLLCLHGFMDTWRTWELVLPMLERQHDVLALTLPGHAGGPAIEGTVSTDAFVDAVERSMDAAGVELRISSATRSVAMSRFSRSAGRAATVVAFAPAGGWAPGDVSYEDLLRAQWDLHTQAKAAAARAEAFVATPQGRRRATQLIKPTSSTSQPICRASNARHRQLQGGCAADRERSQPGLDARRGEDHLPGADRVGHGRQALRWPQTAARYRKELPQAEWVLLDGMATVLSSMSPSKPHN